MNFIRNMNVDQYLCKYKYSFNRNEVCMLSLGEVNDILNLCKPHCSVCYRVKDAVEDYISEEFLVDNMSISLLYNKSQYDSLHNRRRKLFISNNYLNSNKFLLYKVIDLANSELILSPEDILSNYLESRLSCKSVGDYLKLKVFVSRNV